MTTQQDETTKGAAALDADIIGRGNRDGGVLFREWFSGLRESAERGEEAAYVFVMGNAIEILRSFDFPIVFPEINALQTAVRGCSLEYIEEAEDYGYSPDICAYVKADVAMQLRGGQHPMTQLPKPALSIVTNACNTYFKWAEIWERMYGTPAISIDIPGSRSQGCLSQPGDGDFENDLKYVVGQVKELIATCEKISGKKFDIDKLRENMGYSNEIVSCWTKIVSMNENVPAVFNALTDGTAYMGVANCCGGTEKGAQYFRNLLEEMEYRVENKIGATRFIDGKQVEFDQKFRLGVVGVPCYPIFKEFTEMFERWGGMFVTSAYATFASGGKDLGFIYDLNNPIESLSEGILRSIRGTMEQLFYKCPDIETADSKYKLDGVIYHPIKSCRTISTGLADRRQTLTDESGLPTLFLESDMMDPRVISPAPMRNRVDAFFEGLESRKRRTSN